MEENDFLKARVLGYVPAEMLRDFALHLEGLESEEAARIRRVSEEIFALALPVISVLGSLYGVNPDYAVGYLHLMSVRKPKEIQGAVDEFARLTVERHGSDFESVWNQLGSVVAFVDSVKVFFFSSRVVTSWIGQNKVVLGDRILNGAASVPDLDRIKEKWSSVFCSWKV